VDVTSVPFSDHLQGGITGIGVAASRSASWIQVRKLSIPLELSLKMVLDHGEASVIQLACDCGIDSVLIDERKGRKVARNIYNLRVIKL
jgi:predicted nucleic acid-binding protein